VEMREPVLREPVAARRVQQQLLVDVAIAEPLRQRHADLWAARSHLGRYYDDGHGSPPSVLVLERGRGNRDALAADVVQNVDLVRERPTGEDLEHLEGRLQRRVGAPFHQALDGGALESLHRALLATNSLHVPDAQRVWSRAAPSLSHIAVANKTVVNTPGVPGANQDSRSWRAGSGRTPERTSTEATARLARRQCPVHATRWGRSGSGRHRLPTAGPERRPPPRRCRRRPVIGSASAPPLRASRAIRRAL